MPLIQDTYLQPEVQHSTEERGEPYANAESEPLPWEIDTVNCYLESCKHYKSNATSFCSQECKDEYWGKNTREGKRKWTIKEMQARLFQISREIREKKQQERKEADDLFASAQEIFGVSAAPT